MNAQLAAWRGGLQPYFSYSQTDCPDKDFHETDNR